MKLRSLIWIGAVMTAGCGQMQAPDEPGAIQDPTLDSIRFCPDPTIGCTNTNGTGVYYQEGGFAGIDTIKLLITHFINNGTSVGVMGRYTLTTDGSWWQQLSTPGTVFSATYLGVSNYQVRSVSETGTYPTWTLVNPANNLPFNVTGADLAYLTLNVFFKNPSGGDKLLEYALQFGPMVAETGNSPTPWNVTTVYKYNLTYRNLVTNGKWTQYCLDKDSYNDSVVFQGGIDVNPVSGAVLPKSNEVTMSCRLGAPATVYYWGYDYITDPWHFAAGIHMKRASYCGDGNYFTVGGTHITITDDEPVQQQRPAESAIEAFWTPTGASCFNQSRRPDAVLESKYGITPFDVFPFVKQCKGTVLPACPTYASQFDADQNPLHAFMVDGVVAQ